MAMDFNEILRRLPHAYPFRMIDRILEIEPGKKAIALKNVSVGEFQSSGHLSGNPSCRGY